jgi:protein-tyrosine phosphatase
MSAQDFDRILPTVGIVNLRDYGGYAITGGGRLRRGLLFRSGDHARATAEDIEQIADLRLAAVIDLRSEAERDASPSRRPADAGYPVVSAPSYRAARAPHAAALADAPTAESVAARLRQAYSRIPFQAPMIEAFRLYFQTLSAADGPTLVHCAAGKDRTGIAVALLHAGLGVHRDDILADFLLTNTAGDQRARLQSGQRRLRQTYGDALPIEVVRAALSVDSPCLEAMFDAVEDRGGIDEYLAETLGLSGSERDNLAERLVTA